MISLDFLLGIAVGLLVSGVGFLVAWYFLRAQRIRRASDRPGAAPIPVDPLPNGTHREPPAGPTGPALVESPAAGPESRSPAGPPTAPAAETAVPPVDPVATEPEPAFHDSAAPTSSEPEPAVQLSHRVLRHIYQQGLLQPHEVAPRALSQAGMVDALRVRQGTLAGVLRRLEAAGVVVAETTHVRGGPRRVKVYRLTERGLHLARELRSPGVEATARRRIR